MDFDIFDKVSTESAEKFKHTNVGDKIQGTYVNVKQIVTKLGPAIVYTIRDKSGKDFGVLFSANSQKIVHENMANVQFGQIIGMIYTESRPSKVVPGSFAKIIKVAQDLQYINEEWCAQNPRLAGKTTADLLNGTAQSYQTTARANDPIPGLGAMPQAPYSAPVAPSASSVSIAEVYAFIEARGFVKSNAPSEIKDSLIKGIVGFNVTPETASAALEKLEQQFGNAVV
jgi:hypothetical protein